MAPLLPEVTIVSESLAAEFNEMIDTTCGSPSVVTFSTPFVLPPVPTVSASLVLEMKEMHLLDAATVKQVNQLSSECLVDAALEGEASLDTVLTGLRSALQELGSTHTCYMPAPASTTYRRNRTRTLFLQRGEGAVERRPVSEANNHSLRVQNVQTTDTTTASAPESNVKTGNTLTSTEPQPNVRKVNTSSAVTPFIGPLPLLAVAKSRSTTATPALPRISIGALYREVDLTYTVLLDVRAPSMSLITSRDACISATLLVNLHGFSRTPTYTTRNLAGQKRRIGQVDKPEKNVDRKRRLLKACKQRKILIFAGWWMSIFLEPVWLESLFWCVLDFAPRRPPFYPAALILQSMRHTLAPQEFLGQGFNAPLASAHAHFHGIQYPATPAFDHIPVVHPPQEVFRGQGYGGHHSEFVYGQAPATEPVPIVHPPAAVLNDHFHHDSHQAPFAYARSSLADGETSHQHSRVMPGSGHYRMSSDSTDTEHQSPVEFTPSPADISFDTDASSPTEIPRNATASSSIGRAGVFEDIGPARNSDAFHFDNHNPTTEQFERICRGKDAVIEQLKADNQQLIEEKADISAKLEHVSRKNRKDAATLQREMAGKRSEKGKIEAQLASLSHQHGELTSDFDLACQTVQGLRQRNEELEAHCKELAAENTRLGLLGDSQEYNRRIVEEMQVHNGRLGEEMRIRQAIEIQNLQQEHERRISELEQEVERLQEERNDAWFEQSKTEDEREEERAAKARAQQQLEEMRRQLASV